jgi:hypothetical protein
MNIGDFLKKLNEDDDRRATALAALKQILSYVGVDGRTHVPGDADYDPMLAPFVRLGLARELNDALMTNSSDGLNALLDRWFSANMQYTSGDDAEGQTDKMAGAKGVRGDLGEIRKAVDDLEKKISQLVQSSPITTPEEFIKRLKPRGVTSATSSEGLLR